MRSFTEASLSRLWKEGVLGIQFCTTLKQYNFFPITRVTVIPLTLIQMSARLQSQPDWKARLHIAIDYLFTNNQFTNRSEIEMAAESFYKKLIIADKYKPDSVLSRPVLLITASSRHNNQDAIGADYGLGKVSIGGFSVRT